MNNLEIELRNGAIVIKFPGDYIILPPEQAKAISETIAKYAYEAQTGLAPKTKSMIADQIKAKLVTRLSHVIKNLQEKKKMPLYIANNVVDIVLSEVL